MSVSGTENQAWECIVSKSFTFKEIVTAYGVCKEWHAILNRREVWLKYAMLILSDTQQLTDVKSAVIEAVKQHKRIISHEEQISDCDVLLCSHVVLSKLGLSSLFLALRRKEKSTSGDICEALEATLLSESQKTTLLNPKSLLNSLSFDTMNLPFYVAEGFLNIGDFHNAISFMQARSDVLSVMANPLLCNLIEKALKAEKIEIVREALIKFKDYYMAPTGFKRACSTFPSSRALDEIQLWPTNCLHEAQPYEIRYWVFTNKIKGAEHFALALQKPEERIEALHILKTAYALIGDQIGYLHIDEIIYAEAWVVGRDFNLKPLVASAWVSPWIQLASQATLIRF